MTRIADRIADIFPSDSYALAGFLRLLDIVETDRVPTAAVECVAEPRLLINPGFVDRHAATPEKLLMLVMHELHHVLLGHTTLFPRATEVQNFVFDAVINALISRMFPGVQYTSFLTNFYSADRFPECLLRPPPAWRVDGEIALPRGITDLPHAFQGPIADVYRGLYSPAGVSYDEIHDVLPRLLTVADISAVPLIGAHDGAAGHTPSAIVDLVRQIVERWPQPPDPIRGRSLADLLQHTTVSVRRTPSNREILRRVIRRIAGVDRGDRAFTTIGSRPFPVSSAIPTMDRRVIVQRALGAKPLLFTATLDRRGRAPRGERVHIYLDVSGSMDGVKDAVFGAVVDCAPYVHVPLHQFSTKVADVTLKELVKGVCRTTGGTSVGCVARHMSAERVRRAVVITDGYVGTPRDGDVEVLTRTRLGVCYIGEVACTGDLAAVANVTAFLKSGARS